MALRAGKLQIQINGSKIDVVGDFTMNLGVDKRESLVGPDSVHGIKALPQPSSIKGEIRDAKDLDVINQILKMEDALITADVANGKTYSFPQMAYTADGEGSTENGTWQFEAEGQPAEEIKP